MSFHKHKRMLIWDLKELDGFSHQTLTVEQFNMWPSGNCGHVYAAAHSQARRHISGWAMRNTNNHNINILKKSCLGVLVCNMRCKKADGHVVAVRPAICDKARRKQIGRRCPNSCGGVLTMQQCKGHNGYPVTHFWRHHEDKVFFLGKGYHDHPKPELKLGAEKRKTFIRVPNKKPMNTVSNHIKTRLVNAANHMRQSHGQSLGQNQCSGLQQPNHSFARNYQQPSLNLYEEQQSPPPYYNPYPIQSVQSVPVPEQKLIVPDCDFYIPPINQDIISASKQMSSYYSAQADLPYKSGFEQPNCYLLPMSSSTFPVDYSISQGNFPAAFGRQVDAYGRIPYTDASGAILDLSSPTSTHLDSSWHSDPTDQRSMANSRYYTKNVAHFQTSTVTMSSQLFEQPETSKASAPLRYYNKRRDDVPQRLKALWDSIYPTDEPYGSSLAQALDDNNESIAEPVKIDPVSLNTELENGHSSGDVSLKEMMDIDNLDMGDISNILNIPAGSAKLKSSSNGEKKSAQMVPLPNLSSFLRGLDYL